MNLLDSLSTGENHEAVNRQREERLHTDRAPDRYVGHAHPDDPGSSADAEADQAGP